MMLPEYPEINETTRKVVSNLVTQGPTESFNQGRRQMTLIASLKKSSSKKVSPKSPTTRVQTARKACAISPSTSKQQLQVIATLKEKETLPNLSANDSTSMVMSKQRQTARKTMSHISSKSRHSSISSIQLALISALKKTENVPSVNPHTFRNESAAVAGCSTYSRPSEQIDPISTPTQVHFIDSSTCCHS